MDGILPLWKPKGLTSHDCVFKIRKLLKTKKVGHTGTLDPDVDGVLPICIGRATKVVEYLTDAPKAYQGEVSIGTSTTTEDASGEVVDAKEIQDVITFQQLQDTIQLFKGDIIQIPPMYSAVKVNGKRLYEYARQGLTIERPERSVHIYELKLIDGPHSLDKTTNTFRFYVKCSKGTYVRTLAVDIGKQLGYPAHMSQLTRVAAGSFATEDCLTFEEIEKLIENNSLQLLPLERAISNLTKFEINEKLEMQVKNGQVIPMPESLEHTKRIALFNSNDECVAIYMPHPTKQGLMKPEKVLRNN